MLANYPTASEPTASSGQRIVQLEAAAFTASDFNATARAQRPLELIADSNADAQATAKLDIKIAADFVATADSEANINIVRNLSFAANGTTDGVADLTKLISLSTNNEAFSTFTATADIIPFTRSPRIAIVGIRNNTATLSARKFTAIFREAG